MVSGTSTRATARPVHGPVNADGTPVDYFLQDGQIRRPDGLLTRRETGTISTAYQAVHAGHHQHAGRQGLINVGVRTPFIKRDFTNFASEGNPATYKIEQDLQGCPAAAGRALQLTNDDQFFASRREEHEGAAELRVRERYQRESSTASPP